MAVSTSFGPGKTWNGGVVVSFVAGGTLGTCSTVVSVVTLGTSTRDVGGNAPLWAGARKVGEGRVVVLGRAGVEWLHVENFGQLLERLHVLVPNMGIWGSWCRALESIDELVGGD